MTLNNQTTRLDIRPLAEEHIERIVGYWTKSDPVFLTRMGVDPQLVPTPERIRETLRENIQLPERAKTSCNVIWYVDERPVGHSTLKRLKYGVESDIHLHIWGPQYRGRGLGRELFLRSLWHFFDRFELKRIICEPSSSNPGPNALLQSLGLTIARTYFTVPSELTYHQEVNRYEILPSQLPARPTS